MRFKATLTGDQVSILSSIVRELENVGSKAALYLCDEGMYVYIIYLINTYLCHF